MTSNHALKNRDALIRSLGMELNALVSAARAVTAEAAECFQPSVSGAAFSVLQWLHSFGPAQASQIAEALAMDRSAVSRLAKQLGQLQLIKSESNAEDGRSVVYGLTETARRKIEKAIAQKGDLFKMRVDQWKEADLKQLTRLLRQLTGRA